MKNDTVKNYYELYQKKIKKYYSIHILLSILAFIIMILMCFYTEFTNNFISNIGIIWAIFGFVLASYSFLYPYIKKNIRESEQNLEEIESLNYNNNKIFELYVDLYAEKAVSQNLTVFSLYLSATNLFILTLTYWSGKLLSVVLNIQVALQCVMFAIIIYRLFPNFISQYEYHVKGVARDELDFLENEIRTIENDLIRIEHKLKNTNDIENKGDDNNG